MECGLNLSEGAGIVNVGMASVRGILLLVFLSGSVIFCGEAVDKAKELMKRGDYASAVELLRGVCSSSEATLGEKLLLAESLVGAGLLMEASGVYAKVLREFPNSPKEEEIRIRLAKCLEAQGSFEEAIAGYRELITRHRGKVDSYGLRLRIAEIYSQILGDVPRAIAELEGVLKSFPKEGRNASTMELLAELQLKACRTQRAVELYREIFERYPKYEHARQSLSRAIYLAEDGGLKDYALAVSLTQTYLDSYPHAPDYEAKMARMATLLRDRLGQYHKAGETFRALYRRTHQVYYLMQVARSFAKAQDVEKLGEVVSEVSGSFPNTVYEKEALLLKSRTLHRAGKTEDAISGIEQAIQRFPDATARFTLARWLAEAGQKEESAELLKGLVVKAGFAPREEVLELLVECLGKGAVSFLRGFAGRVKELELHLKALSLLAPLLPFDEASGVYEEMVALAPDSRVTGEAVRAWLESSRKEGKLGEAVEFLKGQSKVNPFSAGVRAGLVFAGSLLLEEGKTDEAIAVLEEVSRGLDEASAKGTVLLAEGYRKKGNTKRELLSIARASLFRNEGLVRGRAWSILKKRAQKLAFDHTHKTQAVEEWWWKADKENKGEKFEYFGNYAEEGEWFTGKVDGSWRKVKTGTGLKEEGASWFVQTFEPFGDDGQYTLKFKKIRRECWIYLNGETLRYSNSPRPFEVKFEWKSDKPFTIAIRLYGEKGRGGILGKVELLAGKKPSGEEALLVALSLFANSKYEEAQRYLSVAPEGDVKRESVAYIKLAQRKTAEVLKLKPARGSLSFYLWVSKALKGEERVAFLEEALRLYKEEPLLRLGYARALSSIGRYERALEEYLGILGSLERASVEWLRREVYEMTVKKWRNVEKSRELGESFAEKSARWKAVLAENYSSYEPRDYARAVELYQSYGVESGEIAGKLLDCLIAQKNYGAVLVFAKKWANEHPEDNFSPTALARAIEVLLLAGRTSRAIEELKALLERYPEAEATGKAVENVLKFFSEKKIREPDPSELISKWANANPQSPVAPKLYLALAEVLSESSPSRALQFYRKVWTGYRDHREEARTAGYRLGMLLRKGGKFIEGQKVLAELCTSEGGQREQSVIDAWWKVLDSWRADTPYTVEVDSSLREGIRAEVVSDERTDGRNGDPNLCWISGAEKKEHWIELRFPEKLNLRAIEIWWAGKLYIPQKISLECDGRRMKEIEPTENPTRINIPVEAERIRVVLPQGKGSSARPELMAIAEIRVRRVLGEKDINSIYAHLRNMARAYRGTSTGFDALKRLSDILLSEGRFLESAIVLQELIYTSPRNNRYFWDRTYTIAEERYKEKRFGEAVAILRSLMSRHSRIPASQLHRAEKLLSEALAKSGTIGFVIDPSTPEAGLLLADMLVRSGDKELAWEYYLKNKELLPSNIHKVSPQLVYMVVSRLIVLRETTEAVSLCRKFLISHAKDPLVSASEKGKIQLLLGDCYYQESRFDIARDEYTTVVHSYPETPEALEARFKVVDTLIAQKIFDRARQLLEALQRSQDEEISTRAELMMGILLYEMGEKEEAIGQFKKVLALSPRGTTVDEIIFRLGSAYKELGKYKEALDTFRLVGYTSKLVRKVEPGIPFRIRLTDRNLTLTRGAPQVPVIIRTTPGGDKEKIYLEKSDAGEWLFIGEIKTELGSAKPSDKVLQVTGSDTISYQYDPEFAQDFAVKEQKWATQVKIADDAELKASATEIKEEEEPLEMTRPRLPGSRSFRKANEVKPGNNIYIMVEDFDRDLTDERDTVEVRAESTSGDSVSVALLETSPHSGKFMGKLRTGLKPIDAIASDSAEGRSPLFAIDPSTESFWMGQRDSRTPKWLRVDLKAVYPVSTVRWHRGTNVAEGERRLPLRYALQMSKDGELWVPVASYPRQDLPVEGIRILWNPDGVRLFPGQKPPLSDGTITNRWIGLPGKEEWILDIDLESALVLTRAMLKPHDRRDEVGRYEIYVEKKVGLYPGKNREMEEWERVYESDRLHPPNPDEVIFHGRPSKPGSSIVRARYLRIRITRAIGSRPEIGEFTVYPKMYYRKRLTLDKLGASFEMGGLAPGGKFLYLPFEARYIRLMIYEFEGDAPAIGNLDVFSVSPDKKLATSQKELKQLVPQKGVNLLEVATNDVLEITPGDEITISYTDQVRLSADEPEVLHDKLYATFFNGWLSAIRRAWFETPSGARTQVEHLVYRINPGDRFIVSITDYDEDRTDGIDEVPFTVETSSGARLKLTARETEEMSGIFTREVDTSSEPSQNALNVKEGDVITISYIDRDNTDPGNPTRRDYPLEVVSPSRGRVSIVPSVETKVETKSEKGRQIKLVSLEKPLRVVVVDRDKARHTGSSVTVTLNTTSGDSAEVECRIPVPYNARERARALEALKEGRFEGSIKLMLGDKDSPDEVVEVRLSSEFSEEEGTAPTVRVLNVNGRDTITASYVDEFSPDSPNIKRHDYARLISDATIAFFDSEYENPLPVTHLGEKLYIKVEDYDADRTEGSDTVTVNLTSSVGDEVQILLRETLPHSGVFTVSFPITRSSKPVKDFKLQADFGSTVTATYADLYNTESPQPVNREAKVEIIEGTDGAVLAFSQKFPDEETEIQTALKIAECYYELGRMHKKLKKELSDSEFYLGRQTLLNILQRYKEGEFIDKAHFLLGSIAEELGELEEAILTLSLIVKDNPRSPIAPEAQFRKGVCLEKKEEYEKAFEEYVKLAYRYPDSGFVAEAMRRMASYYFTKKDYVVAQGIYQRLVERYPDDPEVDKVAFKVGLCYILSERFKEGADYFREYVEKYPDSDYVSAGLYWAGDSYMKSNDIVSAYRMFKRVVWDYPASRWAKFARGRLTSPVFDRIRDEE